MRFWLEGHSVMSRISNSGEGCLIGKKICQIKYIPFWMAQRVQSLILVQWTCSFWWIITQNLSLSSPSMSQQIHIPMMQTQLSTLFGEMGHYIESNVSFVWFIMAKSKQLNIFLVLASFSMRRQLLVNSVHHTLNLQIIFFSTANQYGPTFSHGGTSLVVEGLEVEEGKKNDFGM